MYEIIAHTEPFVGALVSMVLCHNGGQVLIGEVSSMLPSNMN